MLDSYLDTVQHRRKQFTVYSADGSTTLPAQLSTRNVTVEHRQLPPAGPPPFVTIRDGDAFHGAISLEDLELLLTPPIVRPGEWAGVSSGYRALLEVLEETVFSSLSRRQLLATSREIEDRAHRVGSGTLHVTFQSFSAFSSQLDLYRWLGHETTLDIHIHGVPDWQPPHLETVTYHPDETGSLEEFWCMTFDGGPDVRQASLLIAREGPDGYFGFWSYDERLVQDVQTTLESF